MAKKKHRHSMRLWRNVLYAERAKRMEEVDIPHEHRVTDLLGEVWVQVTSEALADIPSDTWPDPDLRFAEESKGHYLVSNKGRLKTQWFRKTGDKRRGEWREYLKQPSVNEDGYLEVGMQDQSRDATVRRGFYLHRLVASAFLNKADKIAEVGAGEELTVDHIDRDPLNNDVSNLRWATLSEQRENQERNEGLPGIKHHQKPDKRLGTAPCHAGHVFIHPDHNDIGVLKDGTVVVNEGNWWHVKENLTRAKNYVYFSHNGQRFRRNRFAMNCYRHEENLPKLTKDQVVDHVSGFRCDDSKANLRVFASEPGPGGRSATMQNGRNRGELNTNNSSGFRGVHRVESRGRIYWAATINNNTGQLLFKRFWADGDEEAAKEKAMQQRKDWADEFGFYNN